MEKQKLIRLFDKLLKWITGLIIVVIIIIVVRVFFFSSFKIPSNSMYPTLIAGDNIIVSKALLGARLFNPFAASRQEDVRVYQLPGFRKVNRNDVLVFYFPYPYKNNIISLQSNNYYIKRCVALPKDTLEIINGYYHVNGEDIVLGNKDMQDKLALLNENEQHEEIKIFPGNTVVNWTQKNFGPLYIPAEGDTIEMNHKNAVLYKNLIEWEQQKVVYSNIHGVWLDDEPLTQYIFKKNYYFMAGDNVLDSYDSRYWGLLPEEFIVGKAWFIWRSVDLQTKKNRKERFLKGIK